MHKFLNHKTFMKSLAVLGAICLLRFLYVLIHGIYARMFRAGKNLKMKYGPWAVITGATDGIGYAMAQELARKGLSVLLISRTLAKLEASKSELMAKYPDVEVRILDIDYSDFDERARQRVAEALKDIHVGVLVNNVGVSYSFAKYFHELSDREVTDMNSLNIDSTTWMTRLALPAMLERKKGAIVNISSVAGIATAPLLAQYGAAKSYVAMFSKALHTELGQFHIDVQCQVPLYVTTKLAKLRKTDVFIISPQAYARAAVAAIGYETVVSPYWSHALQIYVLTQLLPTWLADRIVLNMHHSIRRSGLNKAAAWKETKEESRDKSD